MNIETKAALLVAFMVTVWSFTHLRSTPGEGEFSETSVRCVKLGGNWQEPHGISPGWCKK